MAVGFTSGWTSPALQSMNEPNSTLTLTENEMSWVGSLMPLSALAGSLIGGYLLDRLGRKMLICLCGVPFVIGEALKNLIHLLKIVRQIKIHLEFKYIL